MPVEDPKATLPKEAAMAQPQPATTVASSNPRRFSPKQLVIGSAVLLVLAIVSVVAAIYLWRPTDDTQQTGGSRNTLYAGHPILCVGLGLRSIQCENVDTKELRKYVLPTALEQTTRIMPSTDGQQFFVSSWQADPYVDYWAVYDNTLKQLVKLPVKINKDGSQDIEHVGWLSNDSLMYTRLINRDLDEVTIYAFNTATGEEKALMKTSTSIETYFPVGDGRHIYGLQLYDDMENNATSQKLVVIDLEAQTVKDVENAGFPDNTPLYSDATGLFYTHAFVDDNGEHDLITAYKIEDLASPKLVEVQRIEGAYTYAAIVTTKGLLAAPGDVTRRAPLKLYSDTGTFTESSLAVGGNGLVFTVPNFPNFPAASTNQPVTSDFFDPPKSAPKKITDYLAKMVTGHKDCRAGEYMTFRLEKYDGPTQFSVLETGCEHDNIAYFILKDGHYKAVLRTQEGFPCSYRDKLGISAVVEPGCYKPGEP